MALPLPPRNLNPIPNSPFYYPNEEALASSTGPLIVGAGLAVDYSSGQLQASTGGLANITVTLPLYKTGTVSNPVINVEAANKFRLGVIQVGPNLDLSGVGVVDVLQGSTITKGVVQLADNTSSTSKFLALTANQGYLLQQQINSLVITSDLIFSGTFDPSVPEMVNVTTKGQEAGFVKGANLPLPATENEGHFVIVSERGLYTPPGGTTEVDAHVGSWFLSDGAQWRYLKINEQVPQATETSSGVIRLATLQEALDGVDDTAAITSCKMAQVSVEKCNYTAKGTILAGEGAGVPTALPVGTDGQFLTADSNENAGVKWVDKPAAIPCSVIQNCGSIVVGSAPATPASHPIGLNNQYLRVNYSCPNGLEWATVTNTFAIPCSTLTAAGDLITANGPGSPVALSRPPVTGSILQVNTACTATGGLTWVDNPYICCSEWPAGGSGGLLVSNVVSNQRSFVGVNPASFYQNGSFLVVDLAQPSKMVWCDQMPIVCNNCYGSVPGTLLTRQSGDAGQDFVCGLTPGADGAVLTANSSCASGLEWVEPLVATTTAFETIDEDFYVSKGGAKCSLILPTTNYPVGYYWVNVWGYISDIAGSVKTEISFVDQPQLKQEFPNTQTCLPFALSGFVCNEAGCTPVNYFCVANVTTALGERGIRYWAYMTALRIR